MSRLAVLGVATALVMLSSTALAFVRSVTDHGTPIYWSTDCMFIQADTDPSTDLGPTELQTVLLRTINNWQSVTLSAGCSYLQFNVDPPAAAETSPDYKNVVKFRTGDPLTGKFCRPVVGKNPEVCYSATATAITTVYYTSSPGMPGDGAIWDADIELNNINFTFIEVPTTTFPRPHTSKADLENTLTHELGHFQGLDHSCWDTSGSPTAPLDNTGKPIPDCNDVSPKCNLPGAAGADRCAAIVASTMYNYARPAETVKRMPKADDVDAICQIYPAAKTPGRCARAGVSGGCCSIAASPSPLTIPWLLPLASVAAVYFASRRARG